MKKSNEKNNLNNVEIGVRIKHLRKDKGLTQKDFSKIGSVSVQSQRLYEAGERSPNTEYLQNLETHGFNVCYLFSNSNRIAEEFRDEIIINQKILTEILTVMDDFLADKGKSIDNKVKADLISLFYVSFSELGKVNSDLIKGHLNHVN